MELLTIIGICTREGNQVFVSRQCVAVTGDGQLRAFRIVLGRIQLNHDNLVADQVVARLQVLGHLDGPSVVGQTALLPSKGRPNVFARLQAGLEDLEPHRLVAGLELVTGSVARGHVRLQRAKAMNPGVARAVADEWRRRLILPGDRYLSWLENVVRTRRRRVVNRDVGARLNRCVQCWVSRCQGVTAVAG